VSAEKLKNFTKIVPDQKYNALGDLFFAIVLNKNLFFLCAIKRKYSEKSLLIDFIKVILFLTINIKIKYICKKNKKVYVKKQRK
jgi:hypothetical protein